MKQFPISSRGWALVMSVGLFLMIGAYWVAKNRGQNADPPLNTLDTGDGSIPLNTMSDTEPPPMPDGGFGISSSGSSTTGGGTGGSTLQFDVPPDPVQEIPPVAQKEARMPVVWVTETDAKAYSQPGFNMPVVRNLVQWEELLIMETSRENWDRVQDLQGQQFWVQKKIVTIIRPQNLSQPSVAEKKVMDFYTQVAHREHSDAYVHLSPEWKRELSYERFVDGYQRTDSLRSEIVNVFELGEDRYQVDVAMEAIEEGESVDYLGIYTVEKFDGKWYLSSGSLNKQAKRF